MIYTLDIDLYHYDNININFNNISIEAINTLEPSVKKFVLDWFKTYYSTYQAENIQYYKDLTPEELHNLEQFTLYADYPTYNFFRILRAVFNF